MGAVAADRDSLQAGSGRQSRGATVEPCCKRSERCGRVGAGEAAPGSNPLARQPA
jgi:hypothetical protein